MVKTFRKSSKNSLEGRVGVYQSRREKSYTEFSSVSKSDVGWRFSLFLGKDTPQFTKSILSEHVVVSRKYGMRWNIQAPASRIEMSCVSDAKLQEQTIVQIAGVVITNTLYPHFELSFERRLNNLLIWDFTDVFLRKFWSELLVVVSGLVVSRGVVVRLKNYCVGFQNYPN